MKGEGKKQRLRGDVDLPARLRMAGGAGEATCAACHVRGFMVVVHSRRFGRAQEPLESAGEFVTVGRKPVRGACVGNIWRVLAEVLEQFSAPGEGSQVGRVSGIGGVCVDSARGQKLRSFNEPRDNAVERHLVAG